jgi:hypothetical protein
VAIEVNIGGDHCRFALRLTGWQYPDKLSGSDANWVAGEVELVSTSRGRFTASHPVHARTEELAAFHTELAALHERLSGTASLAHLEAVFGASLTMDAGVGQLDVFVRDRHGAELRVSRVRTDQAYVARTLEDMHRVVAEFGVRGNPFG